MRTILSIICIAAALAAQEKPAWVDNPQSDYPNGRFLTAVGIGDTRKAAESDAAAKLAMIFRSSIKAEQTVNDRYQELFVSPQKSTFEQKNEVIKNTTISSDQTLYNYQTAAVYTDNAGRVYALALIERAPTADIYSKKIEENEIVMARYVDAFTKTSDPVYRFAAVNAAAVFSSMNAGLRQQLLIIKPGQQYGPKPGYDDVTIQRMLTDAKKEVPFSIKIVNDGDGSAASMVKEMLSEMGFTAAAKGVLVITGTISYEKLDLQQKQQYVRWSYTLSVVDSAGSSVISLSENGREAHVTYSEAVARASRTMKQRIETNFSREIDRYFDRLIKK